MKIAVIGTGYVGLVSGVCFSDFGHEVVCVDKDPRKLELLGRGKVPIYEPGLDDLMAKNVAAGRLSLTGNLVYAVSGADAVFIAVGTPTRRGDGHADLTYVMAAAAEIGKAISDYTVVVTKSTVPVCTNRKVAAAVRAANPNADFDVASNPEFLREGAAIDDFMRPDRVVVGVESERARDMMAEIYRPLFLREFPIVYTDLESAELIKYAANAFLAAKITFINEIATLCERTGADIKAVARGMGLDGRIGSKFLHAGPGYGGSCFPKDTIIEKKTRIIVTLPASCPRKGLLNLLFDALAPPKAARHKRPDNPETSTHITRDPSHPDADVACARQTQTPGNCPPEHKSTAS